MRNVVHWAQGVRLTKPTFQVGRQLPALPLPFVCFPSARSDSKHASLQCLLTAATFEVHWLCQLCQLLSNALPI